MGVPTSEVGYTSATTGRGGHEDHKGHVVILGKKILVWKEQRNILHEISNWKANWIGHILRRNWLLRQVIKGKIKEGIEVTGRRGRRRRKLLNDLKERRGYSHQKEETLDRTMWTARFGRGFGPVVRQTAKWMNEWIFGNSKTALY
jgi:hypothetical protein